MSNTNLSLRTNPQVLGLFSKGQEYQPLVNRVDFFNQAMENALSANTDWKKLSSINVDYYNTDATTPEFIQLRVDKDKWETVVNRIKNSFTPPLKRTTTPYVVKLVLISYIQYLSSIQDDKEEAISVCEIKPNRDEDITGPDMVRKLVQILLLNREIDKPVIEKVKNALLEWEE